MFSRLLGIVGLILFAAGHPLIGAVLLVICFSSLLIEVHETEEEYERVYGKNKKSKKYYKDDFEEYQHWKHINKK